MMDFVMLNMLALFFILKRLGLYILFIPRGCFSHKCKKLSKNVQLFYKATTKL